MKVLKDLGCRNKELSVLFTGDAEISELNERYRKKPGSTNVLAFPMVEKKDREFESDMLGDVVISIDTASREAAASGEPLDMTINRLLIHGVLHLLGHDHEASHKEAIRMEKEEKRLLAMGMED